MKIDIHKTPESQGPPRGAQSIQKTPAGEPNRDVKKTNPADKVNISTRSKELAEIVSAIGQLPDVREAKVQEIKKSVEAGTYTIDPRRVAEMILKEI